MDKRLQIIFLIIIPLIFLFIGFSFERTKYGTDPESAYLLNGLNVAMCEPVGLYDHPGITAHIFNAAVISVTHFLRFTHTDLQNDVLLNSEYYIEVLRKTFIALNMYLMILLGFVAVSTLKNIWLAFVLQLAPFLSTTLIEELSTKVSAEQLLFASSLLMIILILKYYSSLSKESKWYAIAFGLISGFGLATKFTFLPLLIIPFIILKGNRNKVLYWFTIIPSFILFTLPAADDYKLMFKWFLSIASHTGIYGQGTKGIINPAEYIHSLLKIGSANKTMLFALIASFLILILFAFRTMFKKELRKNDATLYVFSLFLALAASILMVAKHYHSNHYLFPALSITGLVFVFICLWFARIWGKGKGGIFRFSPQALVIVFILLALFNKPTLTLAYQGYSLSNKSTDETLARIEKDYPGFVKTYFYPGSFNQYAQLCWGNVYAKQFHTDTLMKLFPEGLFYDIRDNSFKFWETTISPGEFLKKYGGHILLIGGPLNDNDVMLVEEGGLKLNKQFDSRLQVVFEVDTAHSTFFKDVTHSGKVVRVLNCDFEILSADKQWIMADGEQFCKTISLQAEKPRSGKYSVSMPEEDSYAMDYELKNIKPGELYEVSIWRYGGDKDAVLVASGADSDFFYAKSNSTGEEDAKGWSRISLNFRIPGGFKENKIKLYLWNHSNKPVWFDDFKLTQYK